MTIDPMLHRDLILRTVANHPGLTFRDLTKWTGLTQGRAQATVSLCIEDGLVEVHEQTGDHAGTRHYYITSRFVEGAHKPSHWGDILRAMDEVPYSTAQELAQRVGVSNGTIRSRMVDALDRDMVARTVVDGVRPYLYRRHDSDPEVAGTYMLSATESIVMRLRGCEERIDNLQRDTDWSAASQRPQVDTALATVAERVRKAHDALIDLEDVLSKGGEQ